MRKAVGFLGMAAIAVGAWACSDVRRPSSIVDVEPLQDHVPTCDLNSVMDAARRYMGTPYVQQATEKLRAIQTAGCTGATSEQLAWEVLRIVENVFYARVGGTGAQGAALVNGVLHCCIASGNNFTIDDAVLDNGGAFGVRGLLSGASPVIDNSAPVLTRDAVPVVFGSENGPQVVRPAVLALRPRGSATWQDVANGAASETSHTDDVSALTAFPVGTAPHPFFAVNEAPDLGLGAQVDVIVCFTDDYLDEQTPGDPHPGETNPAYTATVKRNGLVLQPVSRDDVIAFCEPNVWENPAYAANTSALSFLARLASSVILPEPLGAAVWSDTRSPGTGGGASFFSHFGPSNADTNGELVFVTGPPSVVPSTTTHFTVEVQALSGGNAPVEFIEITLTILNNKGVPGMLVGPYQPCVGGPVQSPAVGCTDEVNGTAHISTAVSKAGGYIMCANASDPNGAFTFAQVCTSRFNVRN